jgi:hypothetical protein
MAHALLEGGWGECVSLEVRYVCDISQFLKSLFIDPVAATGRYRRQRCQQWVRAV